MTTNGKQAKALDQASLDDVIRLLHDVVASKQAPEKLPAALASHDELRLLFEMLTQVRDMTDALGHGDLGYEVKARGYLPSALKALQANLRHLTWQAQQVAAGDLTQHVDFMGDFSDAFNTMIERIAETRGLLEVQATLDPLTGLLNRRSFFTMARSEWERSKRSSYPISLLMLDLDHFKQVNDTYGHAVGDKVLSTVAILCADGLRRADGIGRYGGEEIVMVLPETGQSAAQVAAERLRASIASKVISTAEGPVAVTASIGIACSLPADEPDMASDDGLAQLIVQADAALYQAKRLGRNMVRVYDEQA